MRTPTRPATALVLMAAAGFAAPAPAGADEPPAVSLRSCSGAGSLAFGNADRRADLDADDARAAALAFGLRYPVIANDGMLPERVLLARRAGGEWLYVALRSNGERPGGVCFTATFVAARFEFTPALVRKYFGVDT